MELEKQVTSVDDPDLPCTKVQTLLEKYVIPIYICTYIFKEHIM